MEPVGYKKFEFMIDLGMQFTKQNKSYAVLTEIG